MDLSELWRPYESDCLGCETFGVVRGPLGDFFHDWQCWSLRTAAYNLWFRVRESIN